MTVERWNLQRTGLTKSGTDKARRTAGQTFRSCRFGPGTPPVADLRFWKQPGVHVHHLLVLPPRSWREPFSPHVSRRAKTRVRSKERATVGGLHPMRALEP